MSFGARSAVSGPSLVLILAVAAAIALCPGPGAAQTLPTLPQATVDTTMPAITGSTFTVNSGGDLQAAINNAAAANPSLNHEVVVQAGGTFTGTFTLPTRNTATGWIVIRSSNLSSLPPAGTRVTSTDASNMPTIRTATAGTPVFSTQTQARRYRLVGLNLTMTSAASPIQTGLVRFGTGGEGNTSIPSHLILDRSWVHNAGNSTTQMRNAVMMNAEHCAVIDSLIQDAQENGNESHAISVWNSRGPLLIQNNRLEGASINLLVGGANPAVSGTGNPFDITIKRNYFTKADRWNKHIAAWDGGAWTVKNVIEFKAGSQVLLEGNVIEKSWTDAQEGWLIRHVLGSDLNADIKDITWRYNIIRHGGNGLDIAGDANQNLPIAVRRLHIHDNLFYDINSVNWFSSGGGWAWMLRSQAEDVTIQHVTIDHNGNYSTFTGQAGSGLVWKDSIGVHNANGMFGDAAPPANYGTGALNFFFPGWVFQNNAAIGTPGGNQGLWPTGTLFPSSRTAVWVNPSLDDATVDYHLQSSSPLKNAGTDGKDIGADIDAINAATAGVINTTRPSSPTFLRVTSLLFPDHFGTSTFLRHTLAAFTALPPSRSRSAWAGLTHVGRIPPPLAPPPPRRRPG